MGTQTFEKRKNIFRLIVGGNDNAGRVTLHRS